MIFGKHKYGIACLCDRLAAGYNISHHWAAHHINRSVHGCSAGQGHGFIYSTAQRHSERYRMCHLSNHGNQLICHRMSILKGSVSIINRLHIQYSHTGLNRKTTRTYNLACEFVNQHNLIAGRINLIQKSQSKLRELINICI